MDNSNRNGGRSTRGTRSSPRNTASQNVSEPSLPSDFGAFTGRSQMQSGASLTGGMLPSNGLNLQGNFTVSDILNMGYLQAFDPLQGGTGVSMFDNTLGFSLPQTAAHQSNSVGSSLEHQSFNNVVDDASVRGSGRPVRSTRSPQNRQLETLDAGSKRGKGVQGSPTGVEMRSVGPKGRQDTTKTASKVSSKSSKGKSVAVQQESELDSESEADEDSDDLMTDPDSEEEERIKDYESRGRTIFDSDSEDEDYIAQSDDDEEEDDEEEDDDEDEDEEDEEEEEEEEEEDEDDEDNFKSGSSKAGPSSSTAKKTNRKSANNTSPENDDSGKGKRRKLANPIPDTDVETKKESVKPKKRQPRKPASKLDSAIEMVNLETIESNHKDRPIKGPKHATIPTVTGVTTFTIDYFTEVESNGEILERIWHSAAFIAGSSNPYDWESRPRLIIAISIPRINTFHARVTWYDFQRMLGILYSVASNASSNRGTFIDIDVIIEEWCGYNIYTQEADLEDMADDEDEVRQEDIFRESSSPTWIYLGSGCRYDTDKLSYINGQRHEVGLDPLIFEQLETNTKYVPNKAHKEVAYDDKQLIAANEKLRFIAEEKKKLGQRIIDGEGNLEEINLEFERLCESEPIHVRGFNMATPIIEGNEDTKALNFATYESNFKMNSHLYYVLTRHLNVALGGTFDHLHSGHKILLTVAAWLAGDSLFCGVMEYDDVKIKKKKFYEYMESTDVRIANILTFLRTILRRDTLRYEVMTITDGVGPTGTSKELDALIASEETEAGCKYVNDVRLKNHLIPLQLYLVDIISSKDKNGTDNDEDGHKEQEQLDLTKKIELKISSSYIREILHEANE